MPNIDLRESSNKFYKKNIIKHQQVRKWVEKEVKFIHLDNGKSFRWNEIVKAIMKLCPPPKKFLDLGCGPAANDSLSFQKAGYDVTATDALPEILETAIKNNPGLKNKVKLADISKDLPFEDSSFDLIFCVTVIQHVNQKTVFQKTFPEIKRILKPKGYFLLVFKTGKGIKKVFDPTYKVNRLFQLFNSEEVINKLKKLCFVFPKRGKLKKLILFKDNRNFKHCLIFVQRK